MANPPIQTPNLLVEPGFLYWAPLGSTLPTNTVLNSKYTDTWPVAWVYLGATESGTDFNYTTTVQPITVAELYDPVAYRTTDRTGSFGFMLASFTADNLIKSFNGATAVVTGATTTKTTNIQPVSPGGETRCMIGWESTDGTTRIIAKQVFNSGDLKLSFNKAPAKATMPWMGNFEMPAAGGQPWSIDTTR